jgi:hypothetical protein
MNTAVGVVSSAAKTAMGGAAASAPIPSGSTSSSGWGNIWGMFSAPNLKDFVDGGVAPQPASAQSQTLPPEPSKSNMGSGQGQGQGHNAPPMQSAGPPINGPPINGPPTYGPSTNGPPISVGGFSSPPLPPPSIPTMKGSHSTGDLFNAGPPTTQGGFMSGQGGFMSGPDNSIVRSASTGLSSTFPPSLTVSTGPSSGGGQPMPRKNSDGTTGTGAAASSSSTTPKANTSPSKDPGGGVISNVSF